MASFLQAGDVHQICSGFTEDDDREDGWRRTAEKLLVLLSHVFMRRPLHDSILAQPDHIKFGSTSKCVCCLVVSCSSLKERHLLRRTLSHAPIVFVCLLGDMPGVHTPWKMPCTAGILMHPQGQLSLVTHVPMACSQKAQQIPSAWPHVRDRGPISHI